MTMERLYRLKKEDIHKLAELFDSEPTVTVSQELSVCRVTTNGETKSYNGYIVEVNGFETFFTKRLFDYLVDKEILERQD